jgi:F-type H+-transporting ATPase subunit b
MLIDWFTVGAQALNFIILVWLMKRFLYKPILDAIDAREQRIAAELADAAAKQAEAKHERDAFQHKNEAFDRQRAARVKQMESEVAAERQRLLDEARHAADASSAKRQEALATEARDLDQAVGRWVQEEVFAIARKALTDLAATSLEARLVEVFVQRLRALDGEAKANLAEAFNTAIGPALLRSAFDLPPAERAAIQKALDQTLPTKVQLRFETAPELIGGIELSSNGRKVAWSIADYLVSLEDCVGNLLGQAAPAPATKVAPQGEVEPAAPAKSKRRRKAKARPHPAPERP